MSVLDRIFSESAGSSDAAVLALTAQVQSAQQLLVAQQTTLDALGTVNDAQDTALAAKTALDTAQQAAIIAAQAAADAADAANSAQQSALDAAGTINTSQQTAIDTLTAGLDDVSRGLGYEIIDLDVRAYTIAKAPLTSANFQDAIEACIVDAYVKSAAEANNLFTARYRVRVPRGVWRITRGLYFPITANGGPEIHIPALIGDGAVLETDATFAPHVDADGFRSAIRVGAAGISDLLSSQAKGWEASGFILQGHNTNQGGCHGLVITRAYKLNLHDLMVCGFQSINEDPDVAGTGIVISTREPLGSLGENQHVTMTNVWSQWNVGGIYMRGVTPASLMNVHCNQNLFFDTRLDSSHVSWRGGTIQGGGDVGTAYGYRLAIGTPRVVSGWQSVAASGTGATVAAASGDETIITNLTGIVPGHLYCWLRLRKSTGAYASDHSDKTSGYYLITRYISATSVAVRKGSNHALTSAVDWAVCRGLDSYLDVSGQTYHEVGCYAAFGFYGTTISGNSRLSVRDCNMANAEYVVEALGNVSSFGPSVILENLVQITGKLIKARRLISLYCPDTAIQAIGNIDESTREVLMCRQSATYFNYTTILSPGGMYAPANPLPGRLRTMCRYAGANFMIDARVSSSIARTGANVTGWTDLINGIVVGLSNAGKYPQYSASDAAFAGQPSVTLTGATPATDVCGMIGTIPAALWPNVDGFTPSMIMIYRLTSAVVMPNNQHRRMGVEDTAGNSWLIAIFHENSFSLTDTWWTSSMRLGGLFRGPLIPADTIAHCLILGGAGNNEAGMAEYELGSAVMGLDYFGQVDGWAGSGDKTIKLNHPLEDGNGTIVLVFKATFPHGLTKNQRATILDAAANEFGMAGR